jgi:hypothetical protein
MLFEKHPHQVVKTHASTPSLDQLAEPANRRRNQ